MNRLFDSPPEWQSVILAVLAAAAIVLAGIGAAYFLQANRARAADEVCEKVRDRIDAALAAGLDPVKVNVVVKRGVNEDGILPMARAFRGTGVVLRFIEYMDVGHTNGWRLDDVVPADEIVAMIAAEHPLEPLEAQYRGEVANRWRYADGSGEVGVIASVTRPFCGSCNRLRLTADGKLRNCLFSLAESDARPFLRTTPDDGALARLIRQVVWDKWEGHEINSSHFVKPGRTMHAIGG